MSLVRIAQQEVEPLPRWVRLALAGRCLRRARGLIQPPSEQAQLLDWVLLQLHRAIDMGIPTEELTDAAASAYTLALDNIDGGGKEENSAILTTMVAHAAAFAVEAATLSDARQSAHLVAQSIDFAIHAHRLAVGADAEPAIAAMRADLERLIRDASTWSDDTPVPEGFFSPI